MIHKWFFLTLPTVSRSSFKNSTVLVWFIMVPRHPKKLKQKHGDNTIKPLNCGMCSHFPKYLHIPNSYTVRNCSSQFLQTKKSALWRQCKTHTNLFKLNLTPPTMKTKPILRSSTVCPWKHTGPQEERLVFQPAFFRGKLLNFRRDKPHRWARFPAWWLKVCHWKTRWWPEPNVKKSPYLHGAKWIDTSEKKCLGTHVFYFVFFGNLLNLQTFYRKVLFKKSQAPWKDASHLR